MSLFLGSELTEIQSRRACYEIIEDDKYFSLTNSVLTTLILEERRLIVTPFAISMSSEVRPFMNSIEMKSTSSVGVP
jgi:hypothetical protein